MSKKKIVLLSIIAALSVILVLQLTLGREEVYRTVQLEEDVTVTRIVIDKPGGESLELLLENGIWVVTDRRFPGDQPKIETLVEKVSKVRIIDAVSSRTLYERYEVDEDNRITVTAYDEGEAVRTLHIGKASATSRQSYMLLDENSEVYLVSGNYRRDFDKAAGDFRDKSIFSINQENITSLALSGMVEDSEGEYTRDIGVLSLEKDPESGSWTIESGRVPEDAEVDMEKMNNYLRGFSSLRASDFDVPENAVLNSGELFAVEIDTLEGRYFLRIIEKLEGGFYLCSSSASDYPFRLSSFNAEKFIKGPNDFILDE